MSHRVDRRQFDRRGLLRSGAAAMAGVVLAAPLARFQARGAFDPVRRPGRGYGPLAPVADRTTGLPLLALPDGFSYQSFGWAGDLMDDGTPTPDRHDGMAVVDVHRWPGGGAELVLMRNHERGPGLVGDPLPLVGAGQAPVYDDFRAPGLVDGLGGGTTALTFSEGRFTGARATLGGTLINCAGGPTRWGSWLTCEELALRGAPIGARDHGFVFEVPSPRLGRASAVPIEDMGLMRHEAAAVDARTGDVYLTEDNGPACGVYRLRPHRRPRRPGDLERGGTLEMLKVAGVDNADLRRPTPGDSVDVEWVEITDPTAGPSRWCLPRPACRPSRVPGSRGPSCRARPRAAPSSAVARAAGITAASSTSSTRTPVPPAVAWSGPCAPAGGDGARARRPRSRRSSSHRTRRPPTTSTTSP